MPKVLEEIKNGHTAICSTRYGNMAYSVNDLLVGRSLELYGEYAHGKVSLLLQLCPPGAIVVDVGAFNGAITLPIAQAVQNPGRVIAYEASRAFFQQLCGSLALNNITNVHAVNAIVGAESSIQHTLEPVMNPDALQNLSSFGYEYWKDIDEESGGVPMQVISLDDALHVPHLNLIKISASNMEIDVLNGAKKTIGQFNPVLHIDCENAQNSPALIEKLWEMDYKVYWHITSLFNAENFNKNDDNIFYKDDGNVLAIICLLAVSKNHPINIQGMEEITDSNQHPLKSN